MQTIQKDCRTEIVIEKSRFICTLKKVSSEAEAQEFIKSTKKEFWDATHNCSAYIIAYIINDMQQRSSDDGEPSGTAGVPMLEVLRKKNLTGVAAVVTRYFGGIKLGAGGLVRAYTNSVVSAVEAAGLARRVEMTVFSLSAPPGEAGRIMNKLYNQSIFTVSGAEYGERVQILLYMKREQKAEAEEWLTAALNRTVELDEVSTEFVEVTV